MSRVEEVVQSVLDRVVAGEYPAGAALPPEAVLAEDLDVSRLTVREAVKVLEARGILRARQGSGTYVVPSGSWTDLAGLVGLARVDGDERELVLSLLEVRRMLELGSSGLAAARRTDADLAALEDSVERLRRADADDDVEAAAEADMTFHEVIIRAAGNPFIVATYAPLRDELVRARRRTSAFREVREHALVQHERILFALRTGSPDATKAAMRAHMEQTSNDVLAYW